MVAERFFGAAVYPEGVVTLVIVFIINFSTPGVASFYAEMVVSHARQLAVTAARFIKPLRQGNAGRDTIGLHFLYGDVPVLVNILNRVNARIIVLGPVLPLYLAIICLCIMAGNQGT